MIHKLRQELIELPVTREEPIRKVWDQSRVVEERKGEGV